MSTDTTVMPLARVLVDNICVEPAEAVAIVRHLRRSATPRDVNGVTWLELPEIGDLELTAFGDIQRREIPDASASEPVASIQHRSPLHARRLGLPSGSPDGLMGLVEALTWLLSSGRADVRALPARMLAIIERFPRPAAPGPPLAYGTADELMEELESFDVADPTLVLAQLFTRCCMPSSGGHGNAPRPSLRRMAVAAYLEAVDQQRRGTGPYSRESRTSAPVAAHAEAAPSRMQADPAVIELNTGGGQESLEAFSCEGAAGAGDTVASTSVLPSLRVVPAPVSRVAATRRGVTRRSERRRRPRPGWRSAAAAAVVSGTVGIFGLHTLLTDDSGPSEADSVPAAARPGDQMAAVAGSPAAEPDDPSTVAPERAAREIAHEAPAGSAPLATGSQRFITGAPRRLLAAHDLAQGAPYSPSFAGSKRSLVFHAGRDRTALMEASLTDTGAISQLSTLVSDTARNYHVEVSPDGRLIAFDSDRDGERAVFVARRDGSSVRRISGPGFGSVPSWAPDGSRLAFVRAEPRRRRVWNLWIADVTSGTLRRLTSHRTGQPWGGSWFPDGQRIAYSLEESLVILHTGTGKREVFPTPVKGRLVRTPAVAPSGDHIVFQVHRDGVWLLNLHDRSMTRVLADGSAEEFAWSPDGRLVAYHSARGGGWGIWAMPVGLN